MLFWSGTVLAGKQDARGDRQPRFAPPAHVASWFWQFSKHSDLLGLAMVGHQIVLSLGPILYRFCGASSLYLKYCKEQNSRNLKLFVNSISPNSLFLLARRSPKPARLSPQEGNEASTLVHIYIWVYIIVEPSFLCTILRLRAKITDITAHFSFHRADRADTWRVQLLDGAWDPRCESMVSVTLDPTCLAVTHRDTWQLGVLIFGWRFIM
jgi:hypothetical protein